MTSLRRRLRLLTATWLIFQAASLSALVPRDCCAAHRPAAIGSDQRCHENTAAEQCPMRAANGTPCPMHRGGHTHTSEKSPDSCAIRGTCEGPMAALFAQLSNHGVLPGSFTMVPDVHATSLNAGTRESLLGRLASPDPPPPRA
jgi:hypothetical protein